MIIFKDESAASEAIFGSAARGNLDHLSDRDYLIVDDNPYIRSRRKASLERQGWSVASYSWSRLRALINKGALFIQHLKQEALIVCDIDDRLKHEFSLFAPKTSYSAEIRETTSLISAATSNIETTIERAWASDVLAVAVRNLGILTLAERGQYIFDYDDVIGAYADMKQLEARQHQLLRDLRQYKTLYRAGDMKVTLSSHDLDAICSTLAKSTGGLHYSDFEKRERFTYPRHLVPYISQRLVERDLMVNTPMPDVNHGQYMRVLKRVRKKIVKPRDYGWEFSQTTSQVWTDVDWLKKNSHQFNWSHSGPTRRFEILQPRFLIGETDRP